MEELLQSTERILSQTDLRLAGQTTIPDRMVSLSDPDARPIRKGKLGRRVEFGYKVMIIDNREGLIEGYEVYKGNPVDHELLVSKIAEHKKRPAVPPPRSPPTGVSGSPKSKTTSTSSGCAPSPSPDGAGHPQNANK